jgi:decaprenylphospho-beta-D-ribofuranose 2-oxidase
VQWQFVVPDEARSFVELALRTLADTVTAPALVVLKRMGPGRAGILSYPLPGWSMAVDLPAHPNLAPVLDRLDTILARSGGRVYLAKDARLARHTFERMYPELDDWRRMRSELDPRGVFASDLGRRLGLS